MAVRMREELTSTFMGLPVNIRRHCMRVGIYAHTLAGQVLQELAKEYPHMPPDEILSAVRDGGQYHDLGKLLVAPYILRKANGELGESERELLRHHTQHTAELLDKCVKITKENAAHWALVRQIGINHHERWDGKGHPAGLIGMEIPLVAQLVLMADSFDNLTSFRTAHVRVGFSEAMELLLEDGGAAYGAKAVACLKASKEEMKQMFKYGNQTRSRY